MSRLSPWPLAVAAALLGGCAALPTMLTSPEPGRDYHSYANTGAFVTEHLALDLRVDFERRVLEGGVELRLRRAGGGARELVLDTRDLDVAWVETAAGEGGWARAAFALDPRDPILGSALRIAMPADADRVRIRYATRPGASGLQWLEPAQTAGKRHPFLYTQSQAIHARSWIPLQDTPQVRATYEARVVTPVGLLAVMSAHNRTHRRGGEYRFRMPQPIPSYLIALAVGDLRFRSLGPRTGVYAEPSIVTAAAREFEDTEAMLRACEKLFGPYRWDRYDLLILPPAFPYGGMENPRLTFASPTVIAGDKSGVSLVAHELAHSWSGNLVTNATWRDFWLNEGLTTYLTHRIMDEVYGEKRGNMERVLSYKSLQDAIAEAKRPEDRVLAIDLRGRDPDQFVTSIPYVRGELFMSWLEGKFGREPFDGFLRAWFDAHAFSSATSEAFLEFLDARLLTVQPGIATRAQAAAWVYDPELPADAPVPLSPAFTEIDAQRAAWLDGVRPISRRRTEDWSVLEWRHFLDNLPSELPPERLAELDRTFGLTSSGGEVLRVWLKQAARHGYEPAYPAMERYLLSVGRMRNITPIYKALVKSEAGRAFAQRVYAQARPRYHPIAQAAIDRILQQEGA